MKPDINDSFDFDSFVVRKSRKYYLNVAKSLTIMIVIGAIMSYYRYADFSLFIYILPVPFVALMISFDKSPKIIINKEGIWSKKAGKILWESIWYFSLDEQAAKKGENPKSLSLKLTDNETEVNIKLEGYDKTKEEIHDAILKYSTNPKLIDLGYEFFSDHYNEFY